MKIHGKTSKKTRVGLASLMLATVVVPTIVVTVDAVNASTPNPNAESDFTVQTVTGGVRITGYTGTSMNVVIPSTIDGLAVVEIVSAFNNKGIESVVIPEGVRLIGASTFQGNKLKEVKIPSTVVTISASAFQNNDLTEIEIPSSVTKIDSSAFRGNKKLTKVTFNEGLQTLGIFAFEGASLTSIKTPSTLVSIGGSAFSNNKLVSVDLNEGLTTISSGVFQGNPLESIVIPSTVKSIDQDFFKNSPFKDVAFKGMITDIRSAGILESETKEKFNVYGLEGSYTKIFADRNTAGVNFLPLEDYTETKKQIVQTEEGLLYAYDDKEAKILGYIGTPITTLTIPETLSGKPVVSIAQNAFSTEVLTSIDFSQAKNLKEIGNSAFLSAKLTTLDLSSAKNLEYIAMSAFRNSVITDLNLKGLSKLKLIGGYSFYSSKITDLDLRSNTSLISIGTNSFFNSFDLARVVLPDSLKYTGALVFNSKVLNKIVLPASLETIGGTSKTTGLFGVYNAVTDVYVLNRNLELLETNVGTTTQNRTFYGYKDSTAQTFSNRYQAYKKDYFSLLDEGEFKITPDNFMVIVRDSEVTIQGYLGTEKDVIIPSTIEGKPVTKIAEKAFKNTGLTSVVIPKGVKEIGAFAFQQNSLIDVIIPASVEVIGEGAFQTNAISNLTLYKGLKTLGNSAFADNKLTTLSIPSTVTSIGASAFINNTLLNVKVFSSDVVYGMDVFKGNPAPTASPSSLTLEGIEYTSTQIYSTSKGHTFKPLTGTEPEEVIPPVEPEEPKGNEINPEDLWSFANPEKPFAGVVPTITVLGGKELVDGILISKANWVVEETTVTTTHGNIILTPDGEGNTLITIPKGLNLVTEQTKLHVEHQGVNFLDILIKPQPTINFNFVLR